MIDYALCSGEVAIIQPSTNPYLLGSPRVLHLISDRSVAMSFPLPQHLTDLSILEELPVAESDIFLFCKVKFSARGFF